jgi:hypothetical protein
MCCFHISIERSDKIRLGTADRLSLHEASSSSSCRTGCVVTQLVTQADWQWMMARLALGRETRSLRLLEIQTVPQSSVTAREMGVGGVRPQWLTPHPREPLAWKMQILERGVQTICPSRSGCCGRATRPSGAMSETRPMGTRRGHGLA